MDYSKENTPYFGRNGVGVLKKWLSVSLRRGKIRPKLLLETNRKSDTRFRLVQNQRPWMTLKGHYALCFKTSAPCCCYLFI